MAASGEPKSALAGEESGVMLTAGAAKLGALEACGEKDRGWLSTSLQKTSNSRLIGSLEIGPKLPSLME
jgi:hypothetical protein